MINDLEIKQGIAKTMQQLSTVRLNEKFRLFQEIDIPLISIRYKKKPDNISRKRLRLYLDLINSWYPLWSKTDETTKAQFIQDIFKCVCSAEDLTKLKTFKEITHKRVITANNENVKTISRLRWRSRDQVRKNIIHSQI